eukprot:Seg5122.2 transcript_id=Seg5122.2/GoldUCD/mRNA.D3Y31 product="hypothetical protein" protein_id=Seg5122.2/GoldUCD/D3Y31
MFSAFNCVENDKPEEYESVEETVQVMSCFKNDETHQHNVLEIEELIVKLEKSLPKKIKKSWKKIQDAYTNEVGQNENHIIWYDDPQVALINHLKLLHSLSTGINEEDASRNGSATQEKEDCPKKESRYCVKKKMNKFSNKELLKISLSSMYEYIEVLDGRMEMIDKIDAELKMEKEGNEELKGKIQELEDERTNQDAVMENMKRAKSAEEAKFEVELWDERTKREDTEKKYKKEIENMKIGKEEDRARFEDELKDERKIREENENEHKRELENMKIERQEEQSRFEYELKDERKKREENETEHKKELENMKIERKEDQIRFEDELLNERKQRQENEEGYKKEIAKIRTEREEDEKRYKEELERMKKIRDEMEKEHQNESDKMKRKMEEVEEETKRRCQELMQQTKMNLKMFEKGKITETERFEKCLVEKDAENKRLRAEIANITTSLNEVENKNEVFIMKMKEELQEKDKLINKMTAKFEEEFLWERDSDSCVEGNDRNIQMTKSGGTIEESSFENIKEMKDCELKEEDLSLTEDDEKVRKCGCENSPKSKHQHIIDAVNEKGIHPMKSSNQSEKEGGSVKSFAVLKVEDMWEEQIACHQSNVVKLREMQNLRRDLIKNREQLERCLKENRKLRESLRSQKELQETRLKVVLNKKITALHKNEEVVENLKMDLIEEKGKVKKLKKELQKSFMMQKNKDEEINLLNATVKAENHDEYCVITNRSMNSFKKHLKKVKDENMGLLNYCDRLEEKMSYINRELELTRKLGSELSNREENFKRRCKELELEMQAKDKVLKELKEIQRVLMQKYENSQEEMKDKKYEAGTYCSKVANSQRRLIEFEKENNKLVEQNSELTKKLAETSRDLQKTIDLVCQMKIRYEDVEAKFTEQDEKIKQYTEDVSLKENEIKDLYDELRRKGNNMERVEKDLEESQERSELERNKLMIEIEKYRKELSVLNEKLRDSEDDVEFQKKIVADKNKEVQKLNDKIKELDMPEGYRTEIARLQCKIEIAEEEKEGLRKEVERIKNENKLLEADNDKLFQQEATLEKENQNLLAEMKGLEMKLNQREQQGFK